MVPILSTDHDCTELSIPKNSHLVVASCQCHGIMIYWPKWINIMKPSDKSRILEIHRTGHIWMLPVESDLLWSIPRYICKCFIGHKPQTTTYIIVRRAGLLWSQQDFEWRWSVPLFKCLTVLEFSFILFDLCLLITFFNFIMNYVPIVTFWIFTYHKIWILSIMFCFIWSYWIIYFLACLEVSWRVVS